MRAITHIVPGNFCGAEIEPGTWHRAPRAAGPHLTDDSVTPDPVIPEDGGADGGPARPAGSDAVTPRNDWYAPFTTH